MRRRYERKLGMTSVTTELKWVGKSPLRPDGPDKVTGRAKFGADLMLPGMLVGKVLRSPHAHAVIKSIDTSKAEALPGVKAVITAADIEPMSSEWVPAGEVQLNYRDLSNNIMANGKTLYDGHAVAAVAATSAAIADAALELIVVDYEVLPHVIDVEAAMAPDAPVLHSDVGANLINERKFKYNDQLRKIMFFIYAKYMLSPLFQYLDIILQVHHCCFWGVERRPTCYRRLFSVGHQQI